MLAFFSGGYFGVIHGQVGVLTAALAWLLVAVVLVFEPAPLPRSRAGRVALAGLAGLTAWSALSLLWSPLLDPGLADVERTALYLAAFLLGAAVFRGPELTRDRRARAARRHRDRLRLRARHAAAARHRRVDGRASAPARGSTSRSPTGTPSARSPRWA